MLWLWVLKAEHYLQRVMPGRSPGQNLTPSRQMGNSPLGLQTQIMSPFPWGDQPTSTRGKDATKEPQLMVPPAPARPRIVGLHILS